MTNPLFKYFQVINYKGVLMCRPVNPFQHKITFAGVQNFINPDWIDFENFAIEMSMMAMDENIKAGLYDRADIEIAGEGDDKFYRLKPDCLDTQFKK